MDGVVFVAGMENTYVGKSLSIRLILLEADTNAELRTSLHFAGRPSASSWNVSFTVCHSVLGGQQFFFTKIGTL